MKEVDPKITYGNKIICQYMGMTWVGHHWFPDIYSNLVAKDIYGSETITNYQNDWNSLMEVVEKISKTVLHTYEDGTKVTAYPTTFGMIDEYGKSMCRFTSFPLFSASTLIEAVYDAVINYIENTNQFNEKATS